jgi:hypothetical protein
MTPHGEKMTRDEAQGWLVNVLLEKVRDDRYPSSTQLSLIEEIIPREMIPDYLEVLLDKAVRDPFPSIPMLQRILRVAESLPASAQRG